MKKAKALDTICKELNEAITFYTERCEKTVDNGEKEFLNGILRGLETASSIVEKQYSYREASKRINKLRSYKCIY